MSTGNSYVNTNDTSFTTNFYEDQFIGFGIQSGFTKTKGVAHMNNVRANTFGFKDNKYNEYENFYPKYSVKYEIDLGSFTLGPDFNINSDITLSLYVGPYAEKFKGSIGGDLYKKKAVRDEYKDLTEYLDSYYYSFGDFESKILKSINPLRRSASDSGAYYISKLSFSMFKLISRKIRLVDFTEITLSANRSNSVGNLQSTIFFHKNAGIFFAGTYVQREGIIRRNYEFGPMFTFAL